MGMEKMENKLSHTHKHTDGGFEKGGRRVWLLLLLLGAREETRKQKKRKKEKRSPLFCLSLSATISPLPLPVSQKKNVPLHSLPAPPSPPPALFSALSQTREGYSITRTPEPSADGGRFFANLARTAPAPPCARVTRPQITRNLVPRLRVLALYT